MEEREQFWQIPEQPRDQLRVGLPPSTRIELGVALRVGSRTGLIDGLGTPTAQGPPVKKSRYRIRATRTRTVPRRVTKSRSYKPFQASARAGLRSYSRTPRY